MPTHQNRVSDFTIGFIELIAALALGMIALITYHLAMTTEMLGF